MSEELGTIPSASADVFWTEITSGAQSAVQQMQAGLPTVKSSLEQLLEKSQRLVDQVDWAHPPGDDHSWASRALNLVCLGRADSVKVTMTPSSLVVGDILSFASTPGGDLMVQHGDQAWLVKQQGTVVSAQALEEALQQNTENWFQGLNRLQEFSPQSSVEPSHPLEDGPWMEDLLGRDHWKSWLTGIVVAAQSAPTPEPSKPEPSKPPSQACGGCAKPLPDDASFCPNCGQPRAASQCQRCQAALKPGSHFCGSCGMAVGGPG